METAENAFAAAVDERLKALETNAFAVERAHDLPQDAVRSILRGAKKAGTTLNHAKQVCEALGLELYIGPPRPSAPAADPDAFALIPLHEAELSAGAGSEGGDAIEGMVAFRRDWLARLGVIERNARLARIRGDSMEPLLRGGDVVLIDTARNTVPARSPAGLARIRRNPELALYAVRRGPDIFVKRVERSDWNGLLLVSENWRQYPPEPVPEADLGDGGTTAILGQVRWWAHSVER